MALVIIRHKVEDFVSWKRAFEEHAPARATAGLSNARLYRSADDSNEVVILLDTSDIGKAMQFISSAELKVVMKNAGVIDRPDVYVLHAEGDLELLHVKRSG